MEIIGNRRKNNSFPPQWMTDHVLLDFFFIYKTMFFLSKHGFYWIAKEMLWNWGITKNEWKILKFSHLRIITLWSVFEKKNKSFGYFFFHDHINIALVISNSKLQNIQCFNRRNHFSSRYQVVTKTLETLLLTQLCQHAVWLNKSKVTKY